MPNPLVLYSAQTLLAYRINQKYYKQKHWVLCSPYRGRGSTATFDTAVPPSSSPFEIYRNLREEVKSAERHSYKIEANKEGLVRGANAKLKKRVISKAIAGEIAAAVKLAVVADFSPVLYVIPYKQVANQVQAVPVEKRAHPLSDEYLIDSLRRADFDIIELPV
jgi:hypothetical protein